MGAVWPERGYGIDFFEKSLEHGYSDLSEIHENWSEPEVRKGKRASTSGK